MFTMDNVIDVQKLLHEHEELQKELSDLSEQAHQKQSVMSSLNAELEELHARINQIETKLVDCTKRLANIDGNKIREQIEDLKEKRRD